MANGVEADEYQEMLRHGTMSVGLHRPREVDKQSPHDQDEVYIVASGTGVFALGGERMPCASGDTFFVGAGAKHQFEEFSDDLAAWIVFYGSKGCEHAHSAG